MLNIIAYDDLLAPNDIPRDLEISPMLMNWRSLAGFRDEGGEGLLDVRWHRFAASV